MLLVCFLVIIGISAGSTFLELFSISFTGGNIWLQYCLVDVSVLSWWNQCWNRAYWLFYIAFINSCNENTHMIKEIKYMYTRPSLFYVHSTPAFLLVVHSYKTYWSNTGNIFHVQRTAAHLLHILLIATVSKSLKIKFENQIKHIFMWKLHFFLVYRTSYTYNELFFKIYVHVQGAFLFTVHRTRPPPEVRTLNNIYHPFFFWIL